MPRNSFPLTAKLANRRHLQKVKNLKFSSRLKTIVKKRIFLADKIKLEAVPESPVNWLVEKRESYDGSEEKRLNLEY